MVIFVSDHSEMIGDHSLTAEGSASTREQRACHLVAGGFRQLVVADGIEELTDVAPTLAELNGEPLTWTTAARCCRS